MFREAKRAREEPAQDLTGEIPIPSADETLTNAEILAVPSGGDSVQLDSNPVLSGSFFKKWCETYVQ